MYKIRGCFHSPGGQSAFAFRFTRQVLIFSAAVLFSLLPKPAFADWKISISYSGSPSWSSEFPNWYTIGVNGISAPANSTGGSIDVSTSSNNPPSTTSGGITGNFSAGASAGHAFAVAANGSVTVTYTLTWQGDSASAPDSVTVFYRHIVSASAGASTSALSNKSVGSNANISCDSAAAVANSDGVTSQSYTDPAFQQESLTVTKGKATKTFTMQFKCATTVKQRMTVSSYDTAGGSVSGRVDFCVEGFDVGRFPGGDPNHVSGGQKGGASDPTYTRWLPLAFSPQISSQPFRYQAGALPPPWGNVNCQYSIAIRQEPPNPNMDADNTGQFFQPGPGPDGTYNNPGPPVKVFPPSFLPKYAITDADGARIPYDALFTGAPNAHSNLSFLHDTDGNDYYILANAGPPGAIGQRGSYTYRFAVVTASPLFARLIRISDDKGNVQNVNWYDGTGPVDGGQPHPLTVYDVTSNRLLFFSKNAAGYLTSVDAPNYLANATVTHTALTYDGNGHATNINVYTGDGLTLLNADQFTYGGPNGDSITSSRQGVSQKNYSYFGDSTLPDPFGLPIPRLSTETYGASSDTSSSDDGASVAGTYLYTYPGSTGNTYTVTDPRGNKFYTVVDHYQNGNIFYVGKIGPDFSGAAISGRNAIGVRYDPDKTHPATVTVTDQNFAQWISTYDDVGNLLTATNPRQYTWQFTYSPDKKRLESATDPFGLALLFGYGEFAGPATSLTSITGPVSKITAHYNSYGQPINATTPAAFSASGQDETSSLAYDPTTGDPTLLTNPVGDKTRVTAYDPLGDPLSVSEYPDTGDPATSISPLTTSVVYNAAQMPTQVNMPNGTNLVTTFQNGVPMQYEAKWQGATLAKTTLSRDTRGRVYAASDLVGSLAGYRYDKNSNLRCVMDGKGNKTWLSYGLNNEPVNVLWPDLHRADYTYDYLGNVASYVNEKGDVCQFHYDYKNDLDATNWPSSPELNTAYSTDEVGRPGAASDGISHRVYNYNPTTKRLDNIVVNLPSVSWTIAYTYYPDGKVSSMTTPVGTTSYIYDAAGRLSSLLAPSGTTTYIYDHVGRFLSQNTTTPSGVQLNTSYTWGDTGVPGAPAAAPCYLRSVQQTLNGQPLFNYLLQHTVLGQVLKQDGTDNAQHGSSEWFTYDARGRIASEQCVSNATQAGLSGSFSYDLANNLQPGNLTWVYNSSNQVTAAPASGGMIGSNTLQYDTQGNLTSLGNWTYTYDAAGHLARSAINNSAVAHQFSYDALGRRIRSLDTISQVPHYYLYVGGDLLAEIDYQGHVTRSYTWGPLGLISEQEGTNVTGLHLFCFDALGNTRGQVDGTGRLLFQANYNSWGRLLGASGTVTSTPYLWRGQWGYYWDLDTGLYLAGCRFYANSLGRFLSRDPSGFGAGANLYAYCGSDPVNFFDPTGCAPESNDGALWNGIGSAAGNGVANTLLLGVPGALQDAHDAVGDAGTAQGRYDSGKISASELAGAYGRAAYSTANAALTCYGAYKAVGAMTQGARALLSRGAGGGCFVAGTPVWVVPNSALKTQAGVGKGARESVRRQTIHNRANGRSVVCASSSAVQGVIKPIERLAVGDLLYSRSEGTGADAPRRVLRVTKRSVPLVLAITLADTRTGKPLQTLTTTREHPLFVQGKGFVPAGGLAVGNAIVTRAGPPLVVQQVRWRRQVGGFVVYNVVVEDSHTYFVGSHNGGLWVHNPDCVQLTLPFDDLPEPVGDPYERPTGYRSGVRDRVWSNATEEDGLVRDPNTKAVIGEDDPWHMGHEPGYEFRHHVESARRRGITRQQFLDEYNNPAHYRPELPENNISHEFESPTSLWP